jgi:hypothetical protein
MVQDQQALTRPEQSADLLGIDRLAEDEIQPVTAREGGKIGRPGNDEPQIDFRLPA